MNKKWRNIVGIPLLGFAIASTIGVGVEAADYYSSITNTTDGSTLASNLHTLSSNKHTTTLSYKGLWTAYQTSDVMPGTNIIWDIYSEYMYECGGNKQGASYSGEGDSYNREHTVPQSWFNEASPMVADCFHVYPTDGKINGIRSNYPYGEVGTVTDTNGNPSQNGSKLGSSKLSGYSGTVFEPIDEYKGDIARSYFYMAIRYSDKLSNWTDGEAQKIFKGSYPYLTNYAMDLFTKWAHEDPVSDKEYIRNEAICDLQGNRNPFIDHPEWVDVIWSNSYTDSTTNTKYSASNVVSAINSLSQSSSADTVYKAYAKYCRLNTSDKNSVTNAATLFNLVESKSNTSVDLDTYWANLIDARTATSTVDQTKVDNVISLISALPNTITLSSETQVNNANTAYLALNAQEKALVTNYSKLQSALATIASLKSEAEVLNVISLIDALPSSVTSSDATQVNAAKAAYDALTTEQKAQVTNYSKLQAALEAIGGGSVTANYVEISSFDSVSKDLNDYISYIAEKGTADTAPVVNNSQIRVYQNGGTFTVNATGTIITSVTLGSAMGTSVTYSIDGGSESSSQSISANDTIVLSNLSATSVRFTCTGTDKTHRLYVNYLKVEYDTGEEVDQTKVNNVIALIDALPNTITSSDEEAVNEANTAYLALNDSEKALVTNYSKLEDALDTLANQVDETKVNACVNAISQLPYTITLSDQADIEYDEYLYSILNDLEKAQVTNYNVLTSARSSINVLLAYVNSFETLHTMTSAKFNYSSQTTGTDVETYTLVTNVADLSSGDVIVIANSNADHALGTTQNNNNRNARSITESNSTISIDSNVQLITLEAGKTTNTFAFNVGTGYLYAASSSSNNLKTQSSIDENASWAISISEGIASIVAQGSNTRNILRYNSGSNIFSVYGSGNSQLDVAIYKKTGGSTTTYSVSNAYIRFGCGMEKSIYENLLPLGSTLEFGISLSKDGVNFTEYECNPVYVDEIGAKVANNSGAYVQYSVLVPVAEANYNTIIYAMAYVKIDGVIHYNNMTSYSLHDLAQYYIENAQGLGITDSELLGALGVF